MYYSLTFSKDKPTYPLFFGDDNRTYYKTATATVGKKNTWVDWHLIPMNRPSISTPERYEKTVEVPGMNGILDLSESLTGYPTYKNRSGSIEFMVYTGYRRWNEVYDEIKAFLHGKKLYFALEDEPDGFYYGRFTVDNYDTQKDHSHITINYDLDPYKYDYRIGYFDVFNFDEDNAAGVRYLSPPTAKPTVEVDGASEYVTLLTDADLGNLTQKPIIPTITIEKLENLNPQDTVWIKFSNTELDISDYVVEKNFSTTFSFTDPNIVISQLRNVGKTIRRTFDYDISINPLTPYLMGYNSSTMKIEVKGTGKVSITVPNGGRM